MPIISPAAIAFRRCVFIAGALLFTALPAHAYLDPGTGSMILQAVLGTVAVAAASAGMLWRRLLVMFGGKRRNRVDDETAKG